MKSYNRQHAACSVQRATCVQTVEDARSAKVVDIVIKLDAVRNQRASAMARYTVNETTLHIQVPPQCDTLAYHTSATSAP